MRIDIRILTVRSSPNGEPFGWNVLVRVNRKPAAITIEGLATDTVEDDEKTWTRFTAQVWRQLRNAIVELSAPFPGHIWDAVQRAIPVVAVDDVSAVVEQGEGGASFHAVWRYHDHGGTIANQLIDRDGWSPQT